MLRRYADLSGVVQLGLERIKERMEIQLLLLRHLNFNLELFIGPEHPFPGQQ